MLGYFPPMRDDELLYSMACEYKSTLGLRSEKAVSEDFFGVSRVHDIVDIPWHLQYLANAIPREFNITADHLIQVSTTLPYFAPFLRPDLLQHAITSMKTQPSQVRSLFFAEGPITRHNSYESAQIA
jgi:hypothetical protein